MNEQELERLVVRLNGDASGYQKMTRDAIQATRGLGQTVEGTSGRLAVMSQRVNAFGLQLRGYGAQMAAVGTALVGVGGATGLVMDSVRRAAEAESVEMAFKSLVGNAEQAQRTLKDLRQFAAETPFEQPEILAAAKQMIAFGESADNIVPTMRSLGDVSSALQVPLGSLTYLFGTLKSQGRAFTVDINQFAMRGIPIWKELEKQFGKSNAEVRKMVEEGRVGFPDVEKAFKSMTGPGGQFFNMMKEQSQTLPGLFSTMKDNIGMALTDLGKIIIEEFSLKEIVETVGEAVGRIVEIIKSIPKDVIKVASSFAAGLAVATALVGTIVALKVGIGAVVALVAGLGPFGIAMIGTFVLVSAAIAGIVHHLGGIGPTLEFLKKQGQAAWEWLAPVRKAVADLAETIGGLLSQAWDAVREAAFRAWESVFGGVDINWEKIRKAAVTAIQFIEFSLLNFGEVSGAAWARVRYELERVSENFVHHFTVVIPAAAEYLVTHLPELLGTALALVFDLVKDNAVRIVETLRDVGKVLSGEMTGEDFLGRLVVRTEERMDQILELVGKAVKSMPEFKIPTRPEGELERQLREEWERARDGLTQSFEQFQMNRRIRDAFRAAFGGGGKGPVPPLPATTQVNQLKNEAKQAKGALQDLEAVISGSNRSRQIMARHLGGINVMNRFVPKAPTSSSQKSETLLDQISKNTKGILDNAVTIIEANF